MSDLPQFELDGVAVATDLGNTAVVGFAGDSPATYSDPALGALLNGLAQDHESVDPNGPVRSVRKSDSVVIVNPHLSRADAKLSRLASVATRSQFANKPLALVGVSAWTPRSWPARKLIRSLIARSDLTLLADEKSADVLTEIGIEPPFRIGADPAWAALAGLFATTKAEADRCVWVSSNDFRKPDRYLQRLEAVLAPVVQAGLTVQLQPSQISHFQSLMELADKLGSKLGADVEVLEPAASMAAAREAYANARVVVATDRHALMAASASGSPTVAISLAQDVRRIADNVGVAALLPTQTGAGLATSVLAAASSQKAVDPALVLQYIDRAKASISLVRTLLSHGSEISSDAIESLPLYPRAWRS